MISAAIANEVEKVIALSTDNAAKALNLYGATKLASDQLLVVTSEESELHMLDYVLVLAKREAMIAGVTTGVGRSNPAP